VTTTADRIRDVVAPEMPGVVLSFGRVAGMPDPLKRYAVIRPAGGGSGDLVRRPLFTLDVMGLPSGDGTQTAEMVERCIQRMRQPAAGLVFLAPGEPSTTTTAEGRPLFSVAIAAITETEPV
jgi:hypothetical protein